MRSRGRTTLQHFDLSESLFFRWFSDYFEADGSIRRSNIGIPDQSVNRGRHGGRAWHVLIPEPEPKTAETQKHLCMGILRLPVSGIPGSFQEGNASIAFVVEHDPEEHNYCHCEIRVYRNGHRLTKDELKKAKLVKKFYRNEMFKAVKLLLHAEVSTGGKKAGGG